MHKRVLLVRVGAENKTGAAPKASSWTFDDVTELLAAQRNAAWADVARRSPRNQEPADADPAIRRAPEAQFASEITSDPKSFTNAPTPSSAMSAISAAWWTSSPPSRGCRTPVIGRESRRVAREAMVLQRVAHPQIEWRPTSGARAAAALRPAADRPGVDQSAAECGGRGRDARGAARELSPCASQWLDGRGHGAIASPMTASGLPQTGPPRLTEPYVTHKPKGTGLGLAIVKKIMEDHGAGSMLEGPAGGVGGEVRAELSRLPAGCRTGQSRRIKDAAEMKS